MLACLLDDLARTSHAKRSTALVVTSKWSRELLHEAIGDRHGHCVTGRGPPLSVCSEATAWTSRYGARRNPRHGSAFVAGLRGLTRISARSIVRTLGPTATIRPHVFLPSAAAVAGISAGRPWFCVARTTDAEPGCGRSSYGIDGRPSAASSGRVGDFLVLTRVQRIGYL